MPKLFPPEQLTLSNGIPVILQHTDSTAAATYWWVKTGSADESPKEAGFAHFLEHMLFKDAAAKETGKASTGQMARAIESLGGDINAYTSFDQTVYHVTCAAQHWERVIDAFGAIAKPQRFLKQDFTREREVILEELRKNEDSPGRQMFQSLFTQTFKSHPYGRPVIGFVKTLKAANVGMLEAFYKRNYVSGKMGIVLVGPVQDATGARKKQILKLLEKRFGKQVLPKKPAVYLPRRGEPGHRTEISFDVKPFDIKTPSFSFSFRAPDLLHEDVPALDLLSGILGMGELSRLYQELFYKSSAVTEVGGGLYIPRDPGMLYFQAEVESMEKIAPAAEKMLTELRRIRDEGPTEDELKRVIVNVESEKLYATQTADGLAGRVGFMKFILGDLEYDQRYLDDLRAVDSQRVKEVARKYLDYTRMSGTFLVPKAEAKFDPSPIAALAKAKLPSPEKSEAVKKTSKKAAGDLPVEVITLPSGMRAALLERSQSHVFSIHASALGGLRLELAKPIETAAKDWGASFMMALTWTKGTPVHDARAIAGITEGSAAGLDGFAGRNSIGLQSTGLSRDWSKISDLFNEVLVDPTFPESEVEHSRRIAEDSVRGVEDHSSQLCSKLFLETVFENHPYGKMTHGSLESLGGMHTEKLKAFHRTWIRPERLMISVSGAIKRPELESWLHKLDQKVQNYASKNKKVDLPEILTPEPALKAPRWVERNLGREQVHIIVGSVGPTMYSEDKYALRLMQNILGGQSGRLFIELREKKSMAYTVSPVSFEGLETGYIGTYIACSPSKKDEAISGMRKVLEDLAKKGPTPTEMNRAREYFLGRHAMDLQSDSALAAHQGLETLYKIPHFTESEIARQVRAVTAKQIQKVCARYLVEPYMVTSVVG